MDKKTLLDFIANAHRHTYAAPKEVKKLYRCDIPILPGHKDYRYQEGDLVYHDSYAGSIWAPGREVIFLSDQPIWAMSYQGRPIGDQDNDFFQIEAFPFLRKALMGFKDELPFRGPKEFSQGDFRYSFEMDGGYDYFKGEEQILYRGTRIFLQHVMGSLIR